MRWFARGKLWDSREAEHDDFQKQKDAAAAPRDRRAERASGVERRGNDWRPGGTHKDPRDRFKKKNRPERAWSEKDPATMRDRDKPAYAAKPRGDWRERPPAGPPRDRKPFADRARADRPPADRNSPDRPPADRNADRPRSEGGWQGKPKTDRPWQKPQGGRDRKPWQKPPVNTDRPWQTKPSGPRAQRKPWAGPPGGSGQSEGF